MIKYRLATAGRKRKRALSAGKNMKAIMTHQDVIELERALMLAAKHVMLHFSDYFMLVVSAVGFFYLAAHYRGWRDAILLVVLYNCSLLGFQNIRRSL